MNYEEQILNKIDEVRDLIKLKSHLMKLEMKENFEKLENQYGPIEDKIKRAKKTAEQTSEEFILANKMVLETIKNGYEKIKNDLTD
jgi:hypothetical protein